MSMDLITTNTSSNAASSSFTSSIDNTYKLFIFKFYDVNPATDNVHFTFQVNATDTTSYGVTMNTSQWLSGHSEGDEGSQQYEDGRDQAQGTNFQEIAGDLGNGGDESCAGELWLFNPSNTTFVKHFYARSSGYTYHNYNYDAFTAGYFNDTTAIDDVQFKMSSGNMDAVIKMYGVK